MTVCLINTKPTLVNRLMCCISKLSRVHVSYDKLPDYRITAAVKATCVCTSRLCISLKGRHALRWKRGTNSYLCSPHYRVRGQSQFATIERRPCACVKKKKRRVPGSREGVLAKLYQSLHLVPSVGVQKPGDGLSLLPQRRHNHLLGLTQSDSDCITERRIRNRFFSINALYFLQLGLQLKYKQDLQIIDR